MSTNRVLLECAAITLFLLCANSAMAATLLNPSFENGSSVATHWESEYTTVADGYYVVEGSHSIDQNNSQRIYYVGGAGDSGGKLEMFQAATVTPGDHLNFSIYLSGNLVNCSALIGTESFYQNGTWISEHDLPISTLTQTPTKYTVGYTVPTNANYVAVYFMARLIYPDSTADMYADNAALRGNGGLINITESQLVDGSFENWQNGVPTSWPVAGSATDHAGVFMSNDSVRGAHSFGIHCDNTNYVQGMVSQTVSGTHNYTRLAARVKKINVPDAGALSFYVARGVDETKYITASSLENDTWTDVNIDLTDTRADNTYMSICSTGINSGTWLVDDVRLSDNRTFSDESEYKKENHIHSNFVYKPSKFYVTQEFSYPYQDLNLSEYNITAINVKVNNVDCASSEIVGNRIYFTPANYFDTIDNAVSVDITYNAWVQPETPGNNTSENSTGNSTAKDAEDQSGNTMIIIGGLVGSCMLILVLGALIKSVKGNNAQKMLPLILGFMVMIALFVVLAIFVSLMRNVH